MTTALPQSPARVDTCCWAPWRSATGRKAPNTGHASLEDVCTTGGGGQAHPAEGKQSRPVTHAMLATGPYPARCQTTVF